MPKPPKPAKPIIVATGDITIRGLEILDMLIGHALMHPIWVDKTEVDLDQQELWDLYGTITNMDNEVTKKVGQVVDQDWKEWIESHE